VEAVANPYLGSLLTAALPECCPLDWAVPISVVEGCNVTSYGDEFGSFVWLVELGRRAVGRVAGFARGRWLSGRPASPVASRSNAHGDRRKEIRAVAERHPEGSVAEAFFLEEPPGVVVATGLLSLFPDSLGFPHPGMDKRVRG
jgi:hypothetical protein